MTHCRSCVIGQVGVRNSTSPQTVNYRHSANSSVFEQGLPQQVASKLDTSRSLADQFYNELSLANPIYNDFLLVHPFNAGFSFGDHQALDHTLG